MRETGVLRALISKETQPKLFNAAEALEFRSVDQTDHQIAFGIIGAKSDDVVNWIAVDSF
jgi:ethanolamine utilization microcompartment shell protein EutL